MQNSKTLFEKVWDSHVVRAPEGELTLLYIDLHLVHEVTSPQAFEGLRTDPCDVGPAEQRIQPRHLEMRVPGSDEQQ